MALSINSIAQIVQGKLYGNSQLSVSNALPLQDAMADDLTLLDSLRTLPAFMKSEALAAIVPLSIASQVFEQSGKTIIGVEDCHLAFQQTIRKLRPTLEGDQTSIHPSAVIHPSASIGVNVHIGANVTIASSCSIADGCRIHAGVHLMQNCHLGQGCELFPGVVLYPGTKIGQRVVVHSNAVLGAYGFGYRMVDGTHQRTAQLGWVEIGDEVEIGASTTIDRGTYGPTRIGKGTKIDNQVQVGHNCHLGEHNLLCSQVGIAGSSSTGNYVVFGGQAGVRDHVHLGDRVMVAAQAGISESIPPEETVLGSPALPQREATTIFMATKRLPELRKELRELKKSMLALQAQVADLILPPPGLQDAPITPHNIRRAA